MSSSRRAFIALAGCVARAASRRALMYVGFQLQLEAALSRKSIHRTHTGDSRSDRTGGSLELSDPGGETRTGLTWGWVGRDLVFRSEDFVAKELESSSDEE